jgi:hypothetical protein
VTSEFVEARITRIVNCEELGSDELLTRLLMGDIAGIATELSKKDS